MLRSRVYAPRHRRLRQRQRGRGRPTIHEYRRIQSASADSAASSARSRGTFPVCSPEHEQDDGVSASLSAHGSDVARGAGAGVLMCRNSAPCRGVSLSDRTALCESWQCGPRDAYCATVRACPARLLHRLVRRHCCRGLLVRVEKLLGDLERAELAVHSEDSVALWYLDINRALYISGVVSCLWRQRYMRQAGRSGS